MVNIISNEPSVASRQNLLRSGFFGLGIGSPIPSVFAQTCRTMADQVLFNGEESHPERILVIIELAGGNDGLDTVIPYTNDAYYKFRPTLSVRSKDVLRVDDTFGFHPSLVSMKRLYESGLLGVVHGCGYPNPSRSHFLSMEWWHTASPHVPQTTGWVGRLADAAWSNAEPETLVNIAAQQSFAVRTKRHSPLVFYDPDEFTRAGDSLQAASYAKLIQCCDSNNPTLRYLADISRNAIACSSRVCDAVRDYSTPTPYGATSLARDLRKIAALIYAGFPTRVYYVSFNGFDTHAGQAGRRYYLLASLGEALYAFQQDLQRLGRASDISVIMFSEFGRRVEENASAGTDHGAAGPMFVMGPFVRAGFHGVHPSLTDLDENGDLKMTIDFRRVYASVMTEWLGFNGSESVLQGKFKPLGLFR
jgi:uncharacterized protein (DUF1501 family)